ncbi:solute carrier family 10 member 6-like [Patiria miniata]|uniref:Uncharacterized protein n=1 Tax=Patiria miniata TaxID=46514 RepID=A0A913ZRB1_PATMI|nr:solute carrier family 10 member 6-like [Patiria miniata]
MICEVRAVHRTELQSIVSKMEGDLNLGDLDITEYVYVSTTCLMCITTFCLNVAMGCILQPQDFKRQWNTIGGTLAGAVLQYLVFPATVFMVSHLMGLPGQYSIGMALVASCPASALTALVTYYINGDVCLSFCLTAVNSAVSIGFAPAMLHLYSRSWTHQTLHIALWPLISALALHTASPILGYLVKKGSEDVAWFVEKIGTVIGLLSFIINCIIQLVAHGRYIQRATWGVFFVMLLLPSLGWISAYVLALLFRQNVWKRRTICVEILLHNISLALLILGTTFHDFKGRIDVAGVLSLFNSITGLYALVVVVAYNLRPAWTKSGSGRLERAEELHDLSPDQNPSEDSDEENGLSTPKGESTKGNGGIANNRPIAMVWGPLAVTSTSREDAKSTLPAPKTYPSRLAKLKPSDPPLSLRRGPIQVSVI